jgi:hypothetical protein
VVYSSLNSNVEGRGLTVTADDDKNFAGIITVPTPTVRAVRGTFEISLSKNRELLTSVSQLSV